MNSQNTAHSLAQLDLNLLLDLDALCEERSVTKAAKRMGISQPAMSHTLARLREVFRDELIVRSGRSMVLTPRAEGLARDLRTHLNGLQRLVDDAPGFDPKTETRTFRIIAPDLVELLLLPALMKRLGKVAPQIRLECLPIPSYPGDSLETGAADVAFLPALVGSDAPFGPQGSARLMQTTLLRDNLRAYVAKGHPLSKLKRLNLKRYIKFEHLLVSPTGSGPGLVDALLAEEGHQRIVGLRVSSFATAIQALRTSDLILTAPTSLARVSGVKTEFRSFALPIATPEHAVNLTWHPRFNQEPGHQWFREELTQLLKGLRL